MRNTIKAKTGYVVKHRKSNPNIIRLYDGDELLFQGTLRTYEDYVDECVNGNDESAVKYEVFTTVKAINLFTGVVKSTTKIISQRLKSNKQSKRTIGVAKST